MDNPKRDSIKLPPTEPPPVEIQAHLPQPRHAERPGRQEYDFQKRSGFGRVVDSVLRHWRLAMTLFLIVATFLYFVPLGSRISKESFRQLRYGMTKEQVESILGSKGKELHPGANAFCWGNDQKYILICFSDPEPIHAIGGNYVDQRESIFDFHLPNSDDDALKFEFDPQPESSLEQVRRWVTEWTGW